MKTKELLIFNKKILLLVFFIACILLPVSAELENDARTKPPAKIRVKHPATLEVYEDTGNVLQYQVDYAQARMPAKETADKVIKTHLYSFEPLKNRIWNAGTIRKKTFVLHPMFSYIWADSRYDEDGNSISDIDLKRVSFRAYAFYGITDRLEASTSMGFASRQIDRATGSDSETGLLDLSLIARYALVSSATPFRLTAGLNVVAPVGNDELTGGDFRFGPLVHATYSVEPVNIYANLGYTFRGSNNDTEYGNVFKYAFGGEYFWQDYGLSFLLAFLGSISADNEVNGVTRNGSGLSKLEIMPAFTYKIPQSNITLMGGFSVTLAGENTNKTNALFINIQWFIE